MIKNRGATPVFATNQELQRKSNQIDQSFEDGQRKVMMHQRCEMGERERVLHSLSEAGHCMKNRSEHDTARNAHRDALDTDS